ncbi:FAD-dependent monooxygenase [Nonomuraea sp. NPDC049695]|uniref:FAD-dependent monooxygenase n=1 Tax=Nonomuraea sp. NPDC049695 TaxID=3154734 RepID=UPI00341D864C
MDGSWSLGSWALVLRGRAADSLLDTYEQERRPHTNAITQVSLMVGATGSACPRPGRPPPRSSCGAG